MPPNDLCCGLSSYSFWLCELKGSKGQRAQKKSRTFIATLVDHGQMQPATIASGSTSEAGAGAVTAVEVGGFGTIIGKDGRECKACSTGDPSHNTADFRAMAREFLLQRTIVDSTPFSCPYRQGRDHWETCGRRRHRCLCPL